MDVSKLVYYFYKPFHPGLNIEIAQNSIYDYLENTLYMTIVNNRRIMTVEKISLDIDQIIFHFKIMLLEKIKEGQGFFISALLKNYLLILMATMFSTTMLAFLMMRTACIWIIV